MQGNAMQMREKLQAEIDDLKKQLQERTGQLEVASHTILERNEELAKHRETIAELNSKIEDLLAQIRGLEEQL